MQPMKNDFRNVYDETGSFLCYNLHKEKIKNGISLVLIFILKVEKTMGGKRSKYRIVFLYYYKFSIVVIVL